MSSSDRWLLLGLLGVAVLNLYVTVRIAKGLQEVQSTVKEFESDPAGAFSKLFG